MKNKKATGSAARPSIFSEIVKKLLKEAESAEKPLPEASLDVQVDDYFVQYEKGAKPVKKESIDHWSMTRDFLLEAEDEDKKDTDKSAKLTEEDLDVEVFASDVVRLVDNYDSLLSIRDTIIRRAINFLSKNYENTVVETFKMTLEDQHDISVDKPKEQDFEKFQAPPADRASGSAAGGGGA